MAIEHQDIHMTSFEFNFCDRRQQIDLSSPSRSNVLQQRTVRLLPSSKKPELNSMQIRAIQHHQLLIATSLAVSAPCKQCGLDA